MEYVFPLTRQSKDIIPDLYDIYGRKRPTFTYKPGAMSLQWRIIGKHILHLFDPDYVQQPMIV